MTAPEHPNPRKVTHTIHEVPATAVPELVRAAAAQSLLIACCELGLPPQVVRWFVHDAEILRAQADGKEPPALARRVVTTVRERSPGGFIDHRDMGLWLRPGGAAEVARSAAHEAFHLFQYRERPRFRTLEELEQWEAEADGYATTVVARMPQ